MSRNEPHQITFLEKLDLIPALLAVVFDALYAAVTGPFRGSSGTDTYRQHVAYAVVRKFTSRLNTAQLQYVLPSFRGEYEKFCKSKQFEPNVATLKSGKEAFWVGNPNAKYIIVYYHGGGFSLPASYEHLNFWYEVHREVALVNKDISLFFLAYTLVPHGTYPSQICEGVEALNYVLTDLKRSPSDVLLAGDSAGGNLGLAILSHITHPIPDVPRVQIESSLKGLVLIGPWVSFSSDWPSHERNIRSDLLAKGIGAKWSEDYLKGKPTSSYAEAVTAPESWWDGVKVEQLLCVAGANEPLIDPITEWVKKYKAANPDTTTYLCAQGESHVAPISNPSLGDRKETEQGRAVKEWLKARL